MPFTLKIAFLNILRNSRRSLITIFALIFGSISIIIFGGYIEAMFDGLREKTIRSQLGHLQIFQKGYSKFGILEPEKYMIEKKTAKQVKQIIQNLPKIDVVAERLNFQGLISSGNTSTTILGSGVEAEKEAMINAAITIVEGEELFEEDLDSAMIGSLLAQSINAKLGEYLTIMAPAVDHSLNAVDVKVTGIVSVGVEEIDKRFIRANLPHVQDLLYTDKITRIVVLLEETNQTEIIRDRLAQIFQKNNLPLEIRTWEELSPFYGKVEDMFRTIFGFVKVIVLGIVLLGIANTMLMAVMERTNEIGTIRALGNTRYQVVRLFMIEAAYLGIIGSLLGILAGIITAKGISSLGIMMPPPPGGAEEFPLEIFVVGRYLWQTFYLGVGISILSSLYPALKASKIKIIDALRFV